MERVLCRTKFLVRLKVQNSTHFNCFELSVKLVIKPHHLHEGCGLQNWCGLLIYVEWLSILTCNSVDKVGKAVVPFWFGPQKCHYPVQFFQPICICEQDSEGVGELGYFVRKVTCAALQMPNHGNLL